MEVDESFQTQVSKFQRICCNNNNEKLDNNIDNSSNGIGIINNTRNRNKVSSRYEAAATDGRWPSSRIVRVTRGSGGKDRHSKVLTSKGLRDRRVRLSVPTAIQFYDLQDRLGYDQPSKAVEWLIKAAESSIAELPSLDPSFVHFNNINSSNNNVVVDEKKLVVGDEELMLSKSCNNNSSSASEETSKGGSGGLCLSRSENRIRARERARGLAAAKKDQDSVSQTTTTTPSFTDLLTSTMSGGIRRNNTNNDSSTTTPMDYFQMEQQFGNNNCSQSQPHFSFLQENLSYSGYNNNNNRGTLQSNLMSDLPHHHHNHHLFQRFQLPMVDNIGSTTTTTTTTSISPFFLAPNMGGAAAGTNQFLEAGLESQRLRLYGGDGGGHYYYADHHKDKSKS